jgi:hypothetical protein
LGRQQHCFTAGDGHAGAEHFKRSGFHVAGLEHGVVDTFARGSTRRTKLQMVTIGIDE